MAQIAGVSPNHFVLLFTKATGLSPHQYVLRARIDSAKLLLKDEALSIADVSRLTGFRTQEHFTKVFRKIVGVTPREFRSADLTLATFKSATPDPAIVLTLFCPKGDSPMQALSRDTVIASTPRHTSTHQLSTMAKLSQAGM